jgi:thioredoxin
MAVKKTFASFEEMLAGSERPVLVDFYADWCGPCRMMATILKEVGKQLKDDLTVVKIDTEKYPKIASQYQIHALPTLVLFKNGQPADRIEGVLAADALVQRVKPQL